MNQKQKEFMAKAIIALVALLTLTIAAKVSITGYSSWPMHRYDYNGTSSTNTSGPKTSSLDWTFNAGAQIYGAITIANNTAFISGHNRNIVFAVNISNKRQIWNFTTGGNVQSSPTYSNGAVFFGSQDYKVYAVNSSTGQQIWNFTTGGGVGGTAMVFNGTVYVGSTGSDTRLYALNESNGVCLWNFTTDSWVYSMPTIGNESIYITNLGKKLYRLNITNGSLMWTFTAGNQFQSSPLYVNGTVYVGSVDDRLYAVNESNGVQLWNFTAGGDLNTPAYFNNTIFITSNDNKTYAINATNGSVYWSFEAGENFTGVTPSIADGIVYVGNDDYNFYAINVSNGVQLWNYTTSGWIRTSAAIIDNYAYVGSVDGYMYVFGPDMCEEPYDGMSIIRSTVFCPGTYHISDPNTNGVIRVEAQNTIVECNGTIFAGNGTGHGIYFTMNNVTIKNCTMLNYSTGISAYSSNSTITSNNISNTTTGIYFEGGSGNNVSDNHISFSSYGVYMDTGSTEPVINSNTIFNTTYAIFLNEGPFNATIRWNILKDNYAGIAYYPNDEAEPIISAIHNNSIANNTLGIYFSVSNISSENLAAINSSNYFNNTIDIARLWDHEIYVQDSSGNPIEGATIYANYSFAGSPAYQNDTSYTTNASGLMYKDDEYELASAVGNRVFMNRTMNFTVSKSGYVTQSLSYFVLIQNRLFPNSINFTLSLTPTPSMPEEGSYTPPTTPVVLPETDTTTTEITPDTTTITYTDTTETDTEITPEYPIEIMEDMTLTNEITPQELEEVDLTDIGITAEDIAADKVVVTEITSETIVKTIVQVEISANILEIIKKLEQKGETTPEVLQQLRDLAEQAKKYGTPEHELVKNTKTYSVMNKETGKMMNVSKILVSVTAEEDMENLNILEIIPNDIADTIADLIFSEMPSEVIYADPIVKWYFENVKAGTEKKISYIAKNSGKSTKDKLLRAETIVTGEPVEEEIQEEQPAAIRNPFLALGPANIVLSTIVVLFIISLAAPLLSTEKRRTFAPEKKIIAGRILGKMKKHRQTAIRHTGKIRKKIRK